MNHILTIPVDALMIRLKWLQHISSYVSCEDFVPSESVYFRPV